jgi:hypothetical protein
MHLCVREVIPALLPARLYRFGFMEAICREFGHKRLTLPLLDTDAEVPGFTDMVVQVPRMPDHYWTTPLSDQVALAKLAKVTGPANILEVGGFRGDTALILALNTPNSTRIVSLDILEDHGGNYRGHPAERKITRHIGTLGTLPAVGPFALIFIDAGHLFADVRRDTELALPLLAPGGWMVWHDYQDTAWLAHWNRVPEFLNELARELSIAVIPHTALAVHHGPP